MKWTLADIASARIGSAFLAFILGTIAHSQWSEFTSSKSSPLPVNAGQSTIKEPTAAPVEAPVDTAAPALAPDPSFGLGGGLRLVSNQVQLTNELERYKVNLNYPQIEGSDTPPIRKLNKDIESLATKQYQWLLNPSRAELRDYKKGLHPEAFNSVDLDYQVILATNSFLSLYFEAFGYGIGAAHSVQYSFVINYDFRSNRQIKLSDIFKPGSKYLDAISEYCIEELSRRKDGEHVSENELAPLARNFESWNLTPNGIRFNFDACKLFGCAAGAQTVELPFTALKHIQRKYGN
jgi:hypothetical protein